MWQSEISTQPRLAARHSPGPLHQPSIFGSSLAFLIAPLAQSPLGDCPGKMPCRVHLVPYVTAPDAPPSPPRSSRPPRPVPTRTLLALSQLLALLAELAAEMLAVMRLLPENRPTASRRRSRVQIASARSRSVGPAHRCARQYSPPAAVSYDQAARVLYFRSFCTWALDRVWKTSWLIRGLHPFRRPRGFLAQTEPLFRPSSPPAFGSASRRAPSIGGPSTSRHSIVGENFGCCRGSITGRGASTSHSSPAHFGHTLARSSSWAP